MHAPITQRERHKAVWGPKRRPTRTIAALLLSFLGLVPSAVAASGPEQVQAGAPNSNVRAYRLDAELTRRTRDNPQHRSSVIVTLVPGAQLPLAFQPFVRGGKLDILNGVVLDVPNNLLHQLIAYPDVFRVHTNRPTGTHNYRNSITTGANIVREQLGYNGAGIGVAIIDSGIATWHDDLTPASDTAMYPYGYQRVTKFVDFVGGGTMPYDDNGHGTHVAGIIGGNGSDSNGRQAGIAPGATLISLKVLDATGQGTISNVIEALNWVAENHSLYNIRVVNLSVGAAVNESYWTDPLTLATKVLTDRGIVVVTAAGNLGKDVTGELQYGGITAPANAPWVITVGASSTEGTLTRADDTVADFSSSGPTYIDYTAKPDLLAGGVGTVSMAGAGTFLSSTKAQFLVAGTRDMSHKPYLSLSGTSMAAPVVSGTIALMLQANPTLTPNLAKAILEYTAEWNRSYSALRQGAGFLNTIGAVKLAQFFVTAQPGDPVPTQGIWSQHIIWGNHELTGGMLSPTANAWANNVVWGAATTPSLGGADNIVWGTLCTDCDNIVWGTGGRAESILWAGGNGESVSWATWRNGSGNLVFGTINGDDNIVWGTDCGGADCDNIVWGTFDLVDNIVWGTVGQDDNIVWGTFGGVDNIVWGTSVGGDDNIVWGTFGGDDNIVWGTFGDLDNIVWGTMHDDNIVWGTTGGGAMFPENPGEALPNPAVQFGDPTLGQSQAPTPPSGG